MKVISESELYASQNVLQDKSKSAVVTFWSGLAGTVLAAVVSYMTVQTLNELQSMADKAQTEQMEMTPAERIELKEKFNETAEAYFRIAVPLFLATNVLWIIGGYAWSFDLGKNPSNKFLWKTGGVLVLTTATACAIAWFLLIRLYLQLSTP